MKNLLLPLNRSLLISKSISTRRAFTLIEVIVSLVVVTIISTASWYAVRTMGPSSQATLNRINAQNFITYSQEEVLRYANSPGAFDTLQNCNFTPANTCGFEPNAAIIPNFQGFIGRTLDFPPTGSTEIKKSHVTVTWTEFGVTKNLDSVLMIPRPPVALPGNALGEVIDSTTGKPLAGVKITLMAVNAQNNATTMSSALLDTNGNNYNFADPTTGQFLIQPVSYQLTATLAGYNDLTLPISVNTLKPTTVPLIAMVPKPANADIIGQISPAFGPSSNIILYQNGTAVPNSNGNVYNQSGGSSYDFLVPFQNNDPQCFTVATSLAFHSGLAGNFTCTGINSQSFNYQSDGWSSAAAGMAGSSCSTQNWAGTGTTGAAPDTICVKPGDKKEVDISLVNVPMATVEGHVLDSNHNPAYPAWIYAYWHDGTPINNYQAIVGTTDATGYYSVSVPAEQSLFPEGDDLIIWAGEWATVNQCCSQQASVAVYAGGSIGQPLYQGQTDTDNLTIQLPYSNPICGNANGNVTDDSKKQPLGNVSVSMSSASQTTNDTGDYAFTCPSSSLGFSLPVGLTNIKAQLNGYYPFDDSGKYYTSNGSFNIVSNQDTLAPAVALWPIGHGNVSGTVSDASTNLPISGVNVYLVSGSTSTSFLTNTDGNGHYEFDYIQETWPPPALLTNPNYNTSMPQTDYVYVDDSSLYSAYSSPAFTLDAGQNKHQDINLSPKGAF